MAINFEVIAKVIERYIASGCIDGLWRSPSIVPE